MDYIDNINKLRYIYNEISKSKDKLLNILFKSTKLLLNLDSDYFFDDFDFEESVNIYMYNVISLLNFQELDSYCEGGYFPKDEYIFHNFITNIINEKKDKLKINTFKKMDYYILIFILFSSNEEIYNKTFKDILIKSKEYYIKESIINIFNNTYFKGEDIDIILNIISNRYSTIFNISFQGLFFFNYQLLLYDILYDNNINKKYKVIILYIYLLLLRDILQTIFFITFLPLTILSNKIFNNTNFYYTFLDRYEGYFLTYFYYDSDFKRIHLKKYQL